MRIKISSDSTLDLSDDLIKQYDIGVMPLSIIKDGKSYRDMLDISPEDIFAHVDGGGELCSTSGINVAEYAETFRSYLKTCDAVIHVTISAQMSVCYSSACLAAKELPNVYVVDSRNLSSAHGLVVINAAIRAAAGMEPEKICEELNELTGRIEASFILDRLDYLRKGGRCSALAAFGADLFNIKPSIKVIDGHMIPGKKYRGLFDRCARQYVLDQLMGRDDIDNERIMYTTSRVCQPAAWKAARDAIDEAGQDFKLVHETYAGCTISTHCGPNCLGVLFIRKKK